MHICGKIAEIHTHTHTHMHIFSNLVIGGEICEVGLVRLHACACSKAVGTATECMILCIHMLCKYMLTAQTIHQLHTYIYIYIYM